jgi:acyl carrier protein
MERFVREAFLPLRPALQLGDTDDLAGLGVLDSLALLELVEEIQARYGIEVKDVDITEANFGSIERIASYVTSRRGK